MHTAKLCMERLCCRPGTSASERARESECGEGDELVNKGS